MFTGLYSGPYFDLKRMTKNQTAQVGENALIHCAVKQSGKKSVRRKIYTTLTTAVAFYFKVTQCGVQYVPCHHVVANKIIKVGKWIIDWIADDYYWMNVQRGPGYWDKYVQKKGPR